MNKFFSQLTDSLYQKCTRKITCSLLFDKEELDGIEYTNTSFYEYTAQYFNNPGAFYRVSENDTYTFQPKKLDNNSRYSQFSFPSPFSTDFEENKNCYFKFFKTQRTSALLIFSPGWARSNLDIEIDLCSRIANAGIDCLLPTKPFHQERTPKGFYSGELFISANQLFTVANFRQYVAELRNIVSYYRPQYNKMGLAGMSSGGLQAALLATVEELDFYFPFMTGAALGSIAWNGVFTRFVKQDLIKKKVTEASLNKVWAIADQQYLGHNCKARYIKQYISKYDEVVPVTYQMLLNDIYNKPPVYFISCAHTSVYFSLYRIIDDMINEIHSLE
jgi:Alpha/beta hydrolase domain containing 18